MARTRGGARRSGADEDRAYLGRAVEYLDAARSSLERAR